MDEEKRGQREIREEAREIKHERLMTKQEVKTETRDNVKKETRTH